MNGIPWDLLIPLLGGGGIGAVLVALIGNRGRLPEHYDRELRRLDASIDRMRSRVAHFEAVAVMWSDHIDLLERWIYEGKPPPPPPRPNLPKLDEENS